MGDRGEELATGDIFRRERFGSTLAPLDAGDPIQMAADFVSIDGDGTVGAVVVSPPLDIAVPLLLRPLPLGALICCGCLDHDSSLGSASVV